MIDTITIFIDRLDFENPFDVVQYLQDVRQIDKPIKKIKGKYANFNVSCSDFGVCVCGSLAKYYLPSNVYTMTRKTCEIAVKKLSDELHIDLSVGLVYRLDLSTILSMNHAPSDYYSILGDRAYFNRVRVCNSLYYNTKRKKLLFYDKMKEAETTNSEIPNGLNNDNLMRYELRYIKDTQRQLKRIFNTNQKITLGMVCTERNYTILVQEWRKEFNEINKNSFNMSMDTTNIMKPSEAKDAIFSMLIQKQGGQAVIDECIKILKEQKKFDDKPIYYTRLKKELNKLLQSQPTENNVLLKELEQKIDAVARFAR